MRNYINIDTYKELVEVLGKEFKQWIEDEYKIAEKEKWKKDDLQIHILKKEREKIDNVFSILGKENIAKLYETFDKKLFEDFTKYHLRKFTSQKYEITNSNYWLEIFTEFTLQKIKDTEDYMSIYEKIEDWRYGNYRNRGVLRDIFMFIFWFFKK